MKLRNLPLLVSSVALLVFGSCSKDPSKPDPVKPVKPVVSFNANVTTINTGSKVSFTDTSTNTPTSWAWTFEGGIPDSSSEQNPVVVYAKAGKYKVSLVAGNAAGKSNVKEITEYITVSDLVVKPAASFTASAVTIIAGDKVTFTDTSVNIPTSWTWTFEGGTPGVSSEQNPVVTYAKAGKYKVSLVVGNAAGKSDVKEITEYITVNNLIVKPVAGFTASAVTINAGGKVSFTDTSTNTPTSWAWTFEGGTPASSIVQNPTDITYATAGTYKVSLVATNAAGNSEPKVMSGYITVTGDPNNVLLKKIHVVSNQRGIDPYDITFGYDNTNTHKCTSITCSTPTDDNYYKKIITYGGDGISEVVVTDSYGHKIRSVEIIRNFDRTIDWLRLGEIKESGDTAYTDFRYSYSSNGKIVTVKATNLEEPSRKGVRNNYQDCRYFLDDKKANVIGRSLLRNLSDNRTYEYDAKNNPFKNITGYSELVVDASGQNTDGIFSVLGESYDTNNINNITKYEYTDGEKNTVSTATYSDFQYDSNNFLTSVKRTNSGRVRYAGFIPGEILTLTYIYQ